MRSDFSLKNNRTLYFSIIIINSKWSDCTPEKKKDIICIRVLDYPEYLFKEKSGRI